MKNECFFYWKNADMLPRLYLSQAFSFLILPFKKFFNLLFEWNLLVQQRRVTLLDVGCGSGKSLLSAKQLGWDDTGLEIDRCAVKAARQQGLKC